jgi:ATP synthase protein I
MADKTPDEPDPEKRKKEGFPDKVGKKEERKVRARREEKRGLWFGLGMFGLIGWSVMIPTLIGVAIGVWIDSRYPGRISWTLTGLIIGILVGCLNAWFWIKRESRRG